MFERIVNVKMNLDNYPCHDIFNGYGRIEHSRLRTT